MIKLNGVIVEKGYFPDGTLLIKQDISNCRKESIQVLEWRFENNEECLQLVFLARHLQEHGLEVRLKLPYIPNGRQDRVKENEDIFTLKYFAELINSLNFKTIEVLDPHSNVSTALFNRIVVQSPEKYISKVIDKVAELEGETPLLFFPDEGCMKRLSDMFHLPYSFGIKRRDWKSGEIKGLDIIGEVEKGKSILICDDICSRGGTFYFTGKKLKQLGAGSLYLYVTHCENTILDGQLIKDGILEKIYTTDSIFTKEHPLIEIVNLEDNQLSNLEML